MRRRRGSCEQAWIDLENALFDVIDSDDETLVITFRHVVDEIRRHAPSATIEACGDRRLVRRLVAVAAGLTSVRLFPGPAGPDRADHELIDRIRRHTCPRTDHVVIVSGDGAFAESVTELQAGGIDVTVIAAASTVATRLRVAADGYVELAPAAQVSQVDSGDVA